MIVVDKLYKLLCTIVVVCMALMTAMVFTNTVLRYLSDTSIIASEELSRFLFMWMIFCGCILAVADDIHIKVDLVTRRLPVLVQKALKVVVELLMIVICVILAIGGWVQTAINFQNYAPATNIPLAYVYVSVFISGAAMAAISLTRVVKIFMPEKAGEAAQ